jgi:transcriptional regulator PpsR
LVSAGFFLQSPSTNLNDRVMRKVAEQSSKQSRFNALQPEAMAKIVSATADVALVVDDGGVVLHVEFGGDRGLASLLDGLIGRHWLDTVTPESRSKASDLLQEAAANDDARPREINHPASERDSVPIRYSAIRNTGSNEIIVIGRDLRNLAELEQRLAFTQQALERDYARLRAAEARYRLHFAVSSEAAIIADASNRRIIEANPAALAIFGDRVKASGRTIQQLFDAPSQDAFLSLLARATTSSEGAEGVCRLADGKRDVTLHTVLFRQEGVSLILLRVLQDAARATSGAALADELPFTEAVEHLPDGFVITNHEGRVLAVNPAFLELVELGTAQQSVGQNVDRWLGRSSIDLASMRDLLARDGAIRSFSTLVRGAFGTTADVDISATAFGKKNQTHAYLIRRRSTAPNLESRLMDDLPQSVQHMAELVGSVPMKDLVRQTADIIERLCIEAALRLTGDNRASAADLLGLSRQSLYAKLDRYGLKDLEPEAL